MRLTHWSMSLWLMNPDSERAVGACAYLDQEEGDAVGLERSRKGRVFDLGINLRQSCSLLVLLQMQSSTVFHSCPPTNLHTVLSSSILYTTDRLIM